MRTEQIDPGHREKRNALRLIGVVLLGLGGLLTLVGFVSFFSAFGSFEPPRFFWCAFLGLPMAFAGFAVTAAGFKGAAMRYMAEEVAPVATDTLNYVAEGSQPGIKTVTSAIGEGLRAGLQEAKLSCPKCKCDNAADARFCNQCGSPLMRKICAKCNTSNEATAQFCTGCGNRF